MITVLFWNMTNHNPRYLSVDMTFQSLYFLSEFPSWRVTVHNKDKPRVPNCKIEIMTSDVLLSPSWLDKPLRNICFIRRVHNSSFSQYDSCHFKIIKVDIAHDCVSGITFFFFSELFWNAFSLYSDSMTRSYISRLGELISIRCC